MRFISCWKEGYTFKALRYFSRACRGSFPVFWGSNEVKYWGKLNFCWWRCEIRSRISLWIRTSSLMKVATPIVRYSEAFAGCCWEKLRVWREVSLAESLVWGCWSISLWVRLELVEKDCWCLGLSWSWVELY